MPKKRHPKPGDWDFKVMVWQRAALGERTASILRYFELNAGRNRYPKDRPDRETISNTLTELDSLSPEVIGRLSPEVQAYAVSRRPELKAELERSKEQRAARRTNWIEEYEAKHGRLPPLPEPLGRLVMNYVQGQPVRKDTVVGFANMGQWNAIKGVPGLEKKWREFLEWKGEDPDEYEYKVTSLGPPKRNPHPLVWKPTRRS